ncbi:MAG: hypothetical protein HY980_00170 [Candidatus Magasanikbacteria bacterium]|nr:hypothetical protein [Candidatus Magasanikbacteria bacterium]
MVLTSSTSGQVELPSGSTAVQLSGTAVLDVSSKMTSAASGNIVIGGVEKTLSNFTSGNLSGVNLSLLQIVGDYAITVAKAVRLLSGVADQPFTLTNTGVSSITVTLPDAVSVLAPSGWNGTIAPPQTVSASGVAPPGFSLGSTAVEVGSSASILLFDKPVALVLSGVTGSVGYKPAGSSNWTQITNTCGGSYASPSAPSFPGECSVSNGSDTKIYTYHFTTFGSLNAVSASSPTPVSSGGNNGGGGGGGSGGIIATVTSVNFSGRAYPKSTVTLLKDAQIAGTTIAGTDANFQISISSLSSGNYIFSLYGEDSKGVRSSLLTFPTSVTSGVTTYVSGIFIAPTIAVDKSEVKRGDNIAIFGQSVPNGDITIGVNSDEEFFNKTKAGQNGAYLLYFDTSPLAVEQHFVRSKAASNDAVSSFSKSISFVVGTKNIAANAPKTVEKGDINGDKRVNLVDFSIVAYWYKRPSPPASSDLNGDGKVNLIDFSIMAFYWTG